MQSYLVTAGKPVATGAIFFAEGTTAPLPTSTSDELDSAYVELGYASDDGLVNGTESDSEGVTAWGATTVLTLTTSFTDTFSITLIETLNADVLKSVFGSDYVTVDSSTGAVSLSRSSNNGSEGRWVFDILTSLGTKRIVLPDAEITEIGEVSYVDGDAVGLPLTLTCKPDSSSNTHYEYISPLWSMTLTEDTAVDTSKTYYALDSTTGEYAAVSSPTSANLGSYYERVYVY